MAQSRSAQGGRSVNIEVPEDLIYGLSRAAQARRMTVQELCSETILRLATRNRQDRSAYRDCSLTAKLTAREMDAVKSIAMYRGITPAEWCREAVLTAADPERRSLVAEIAALRMFVLGIIAHLRVGSNTTVEHLSAYSKQCDRFADKRALGLVNEVNSQCAFPGCSCNVALEGLPGNTR